MLEKQQISVKWNVISAVQTSTMYVSHQHMIFVLDSA
jgi:hypothetical protein